MLSLNKILYMKKNSICTFITLFAKLQSKEGSGWVEHSLAQFIKNI